MINYLIYDIKKNYNNPKGLFFLFLFRITNFVYVVSRKIIITYVILIPLVIIYKVITELLMGVEISYKTEIGKGLTFHHVNGTVINMNVVIGDNCLIRHLTTIGVSKKNSRCPVIGNNVNIGSNSVILGDITIGDNVIIGAGSIVVKSILENDIVAGNPARSIKK